MWLMSLLDSPPPKGKGAQGSSEKAPFPQVQEGLQRDVKLMLLQSHAPDVLSYGGIRRKSRERISKVL